MAHAKFSAVFGQVVRRHRLARDLSQERLAEDAEIHRTHVGLLERGLRSASLDIAERVAWALGVPLSALIAETEREWPRRGGGSPVRRKS